MLGVKDKVQFEILRGELDAFPDYPILQADYKEAATCFNKCRARGVRGSNTDFLICAVGLRNKFQIFTADRDFERFASVLSMALFEAKN